MGLPRALEVALAAIGLTITSPLLVLAAIAIKFDSRGPVFFRQQRVGRYGKQFTLLKLRTMFVSDSGSLVTAANDERITRVGRFLRKTKADELPELWNIVRGEMCIVGPRPEVPELVDLNDPQWDEILKTNPGLTDPVTLRLRNEEELLANAGGDSDYYENVVQPYKLRGYVRFLRERNWKTDVTIIYQTMKAIVSPGSIGVPSDDELRYS